MSNKPVFEDKQMDAEKGTIGTDANGVPPPYAGSDDQFMTAADNDEYSKLGFWTRMGCTPESFKRRSKADEYNQLNQTLKSRHMHMIAIGGSIGAGLFVGSGGALATGGPASLIITFMIIGVMIFNVVYALGELAIMFPVSGGFYTYSTRFIDPSWGFAMGWNYVLQWAIVLPLEIGVAAITIGYWDSGVSDGVWITVFFLVIIIINVFGVLGYGEEEFWSSFLKLSAIVIFMIIALILVLGGGPQAPYNEYWGARTWYNPGAFNNGFKGFCATFVTAAFSFSGTELVGLAAAESKNPLKSLPSAVKQVFWRITLFYVLALLFVGLLVPYDNPNLLGGSGGAYADTSPFVIASREAGLIGFDSFMNVVILVSVISIGNSGVFGGSRTLTALAEQGYAPKIFAYVDKAGRPLVSTVTIIAFSGIAYINLDADGSLVFDWLLALSGLAALFTWGSISFAHIRFRAAWKHQGHTLEEIPFKALGGVWGSWLALFIIFIALAAQFYTAAFPIGASSDDPAGERVASFFKSYLALPVVIVFWIVGFLWKREGFRTLDQMDLVSGRRYVDLEAWYAEKERKKQGPWYKRIAYFMF